MLLFRNRRHSICCCVIVLTTAAIPVSVGEALIPLEVCSTPFSNTAPYANLATVNQAKGGLMKGEVTWVGDGDSIRVRIEETDFEVRLADIDAPERDQPHGWEAKLGLIDLVRGRQVTLVPQALDHHGRIVARVWVEQLDVNRELMRRGLVWFYPTFAKDRSLSCEERRARGARIGLWAQSTPQAPWHWRRQTQFLEHQ